MPRRHVFRDLEPYMCTFKRCTAPPFTGQHAWFDHELQAHRKKWRCNLCRCSPFSTARMLQEHMHLVHRERFTQVQLPSILQSCEIIDDKFAASACPLCKDWTLFQALENAESHTIFGTAKQFRRHLAKHMEQIALFALPKIDCGDSKDEDNSKGANAGADALPQTQREHELSQQHSGSDRISASLPSSIMVKMFNDGRHVTMRSLAGDETVAERRARRQHRLQTVQTQASMSELSSGTGTDISESDSNKRTRAERAWAEEEREKMKTYDTETDISFYDTDRIRRRAERLLAKQARRESEERAWAEEEREKMRTYDTGTDIN